MLQPAIKHLKILILLHIDEMLECLDYDDQFVFMLVSLTHAGHQNVLILLGPIFDISLPFGMNDGIEYVLFSAQLFVRIFDLFTELCSFNSSDISINFERFL